MKTLLDTAIMLSLLVIGLHAMANTYYVSPHGNDAWNGALDRPFRTIQHAADLMQPGDNCLIRGGEYAETVRPAHSGLAGEPITFRAYQHEQVTISGADAVHGWVKDHEHIYRAQWSGDLGKNNQLFFDNQTGFRGALAGAHQ